MFLAIFICSAHAKNADEPLVINEQDIQNSEPVRQLTALKEELEEEASKLTRQVFAWLFPFGPAWNSVLGTFYISSVPNMILAFIPAQISPNTLNTMTAFATGGLLSDVFLHLVPHSFLGESQGGGVRLVLVEEKRNILVGLAIFIGFAAFFIMEKSLRVLGGEEEGHSHSHSHSHSPPTSVSSAVESSSKDGLRARKDKGGAPVEEPIEGKVNAPSKLSAYLNLFGDFVHNITDGLAMAASFYSSPLIGATTTLACFAHEIPHEIADYSILVRSGFTKRQAMQSQYLTAVGAFVGYESHLATVTFMGIAIHNMSAGEGGTEPSLDLAAALRRDASGLLGTTVQYGELVIPFVAGGFLYIGAVAVLPTLLAESKSAKQALREFVAMAIGVACMLAVAWNE
ncbi:ZIP-like iron-zinc transporter [Hysterangium stoloniferum]|nr:ZIP-like iron-zinc transporter [Hysterangium stoloniferum]